MKRIARFLFVAAILLAVAQPMFACIVCGDWGYCTPGIGLRCKPTQDGCTHSMYLCSAPPEPLAAEYRIASVEISHESNVQVAVVTKDGSARAELTRREARAPLE